jgi:hypothetical protein
VTDRKRGDLLSDVRISKRKGDGATLLVTNLVEGNLQSYWTTTQLWKLTVVLDYYEAMETYSRIGLLRSYGNLKSYWTTTKLWKLTVVLDYNDIMKAIPASLG